MWFIYSFSQYFVPGNVLGPRKQALKLYLLWTYILLARNGEWMAGVIL